MQTFSQVMAVNIPWLVSVVGRSFRLLEMAGSAELIFYRNGSMVGQADDMQSGFSWESVEFDQVKITAKSGAGGLVKFVVSDGITKYDRPMMGGAISSSTIVNVLTTSSVILAGRSGRRYLLIQNTGGGDVWLNFGAAAVMATSIKLAVGSSIEFVQYVPTNDIHGITSGTVQLTVIEG